ncbi:MAG TPA: DNA repair exonuclease [Desulfobulbus sp.]|nr:DNA repair exonuclease [Desulfobulbus sp.]
MFTFIHAADIHLDSPLKNLAIREGAPVETIRGAARRAFDNLIELAVAEPVDFLLLAGDLYDGSWKDYNTGLYFLDRMRRLRKAGIRVVLVSGNHDAASRITRALRLPDNVTHLSSRSPRTLELEDLAVAIHGQSYPRRAVRENLVPAYPDPMPDLFNIGLLHTALTGRPGHEPYAPCTRDDLIHKGYDYWALGHIHQREEVCRDPWIVFPGNLQGRHIRETGAKGAILVRVEHGQVARVEFRELDVVRWSFRQLDCGDIHSEGELLERAGDAFQQEADSADGRPLMLRLELHGTCPFHGELVRDLRYWEHALEGVAIDTGDIWLEKILFHTRRPRDLDPAALDGSSIEPFFQAVDQEAVELFEAPELQKLLGRLPAELLRTQPLLPQDPQEQQLLLQEIRDMVLAGILEQREP